MLREHALFRLRRRDTGVHRLECLILRCQRGLRVDEGLFLRIVAFGLNLLDWLSCDVCFQFLLLLLQQFADLRLVIWRCLLLQCHDFRIGLAQCCPRTG